MIVTSRSDDLGPQQFPEQILPLMIRKAIAGAPRVAGGRDRGAQLGLAGTR